MKCLRGASALADLLKRDPDPSLRVFAVWLPVISTDWGPPGAAALARLSDPRAAHFWDRRRALSDAIRAAGDDRVLGARRLKGRIVWDYVAVFPPGARWGERYPVPEYAGAPVLDLIAELEPHLRAKAPSGHPSEERMPLGAR